MRIFKFGGASVKDAEGIHNMYRVLEQTGHAQTLIVVSAMGKTTNAFEKLIEAYFDDAKQMESQLNEIIDYHLGIMNEIFDHPKHDVFDQVKQRFDRLRTFLKNNKSPHYSFVYDQVVSTGELVSTAIITHFLNEKGIAANWLDARECIQTDTSYRDANVDWARTEKAIREKVNPGQFYITQGFIGSDDNNFTTTLGREGSDYTAAIFAYCLNGNSVTIWKDVPGVLNADPRHFESTKLLHHISYQEAIELAFYGASVIHPKTLQPLQRKEIPLHVKSFINPKDEGTKVSKGVAIDPHIPCYIVKNNLALIKLSSLDFSFIIEKNISDIFAMLHKYKMKVDLIQNSAISFSVCVFDKFDKIEELLHELRGRFQVDHKQNVSLYTIRHFQPESAAFLLRKHELLLEQRTQETMQMVMR
ncbi:MAG: aspartokinase [Flavobacteriaceae bacterium]|nr:MAG: aspartokinase [Flavobacteriaceae bacterium]